MATAMPSVIAELTDKNITLDFRHVLELVEEWKSRLSSLYGDIVPWLPQFSADQSDSAEMHEELMREYGGAPVQLPILRISDGHADVARFVPRVALDHRRQRPRTICFREQNNTLLSISSDYFSAPSWEIAPALHRLDTKALSRETLAQSFQ